MSFYFYIRSENKITYQQITDKLNFANIEFDYLDNLNEPIGENNRKIFIRHKSARGVNLYYQDKSYSVGLNIFSSQDDFELALDTVLAIDELTNGMIFPEDKEMPIDRNYFKAEYSQKWIESQKYSGIGFVIEKAGIESQIVSIGCCYMTYSIGPKVHSRLDSSSEKAYYEGLVSHICQTQFWDRAKYSVPGILEITDKNGDKNQLIILYKNGNQFLSKADALVIPNGDMRAVIPFSEIESIANSKFHPVDEEQFLVDELSDEEYDAIYLKALEISERKKKEKADLSNNDDPFPEKDTPATKKPWWKFW